MSTLNTLRCAPSILVFSGSDPNSHEFGYEVPIRCTKKLRDRNPRPGVAGPSFTSRLTPFGHLAKVLADLFHLSPQFLDLSTQFHHGAFQLRTGCGNVRTPVRICGRRAFAAG